MNDDTLEKIYQTMGVTRSVLYKIQRAGYTIVRTGDITKRAILTANLENELGLII
ncbi:hypothetical protein [Rodentibacter caecimuris]|uniref:hypothetical protein n=1 Tax=Rodentibacter caecimuris TaxID=1796644 RepID=UPI0015C3A208